MRWCLVSVSTWRAYIVYTGREVPTLKSTIRKVYVSYRPCDAGTSCRCKGRQAWGGQWPGVQGASVPSWYLMKGAQGAYLQHLFVSVQFKNRLILHGWCVFYSAMWFSFRAVGSRRVFHTDSPRVSSCLFLSAHFVIRTPPELLPLLLLLLLLLVIPWV